MRLECPWHSENDPLPEADCKSYLSKLTEMYGTTPCPWNGENDLLPELVDRELLDELETRFPLLDCLPDERVCPE